MAALRPYSQAYSPQRRKLLLTGGALLFASTAGFGSYRVWQGFLQKTLEEQVHAILAAVPIHRSIPSVENVRAEEAAWTVETLVRAITRGWPAGTFYSHSRIQEQLRQQIGHEFQAGLMHEWSGWLYSDTEIRVMALYTLTHRHAD